MYPHKKGSTRKAAICAFGRLFLAEEDFPGLSLYKLLNEVSR
jgi:hypothetical protein